MPIKNNIKLSSNFSLGKFLRLWEEIMQSIITLMYVVTTIEDDGNSIQGLRRKKVFSATLAVQL